MDLMTKKLRDQFKKTGNQENIKDPIVIAKYFNPLGAGTWYATEYNAIDRTFFGYVSIFGDGNDEWGDFSLDELANVEVGMGLGIERDLYFTPQPISKLQPKAV